MPDPRCGGTGPDGTGRGGAFTVRYDEAGEEGLVETLVLAISAVSGIPPESMEPLYDVVEPEVVERIVVRDASGGDGNLRIRFVSNGVRVIVHGTGEIELFSEPVPAR